MKRDPWQPLGTAIAVTITWLQETAARIDARFADRLNDPEER